MAVPQAAVVALLVYWGFNIHAAVVGVLLLVQGALMVRLVAKPRERAAWYNATGTTLYVSGMMVSAFAVGAMQGGA
jgi:chlorophyll synthase